jgi:hypothetical protein
MSPLLLIVIILLVVLMAGGGYGYRAGWASGYPYYGPGFGLLGIILIVVLILLLMGRL